MASQSTLFSPINVGTSQLQHRIVLAPLTRLRANHHVPTDLMVEHYAQRATPGGLLIAESAYISPTSGGYPGAPGLYSDEQIQGWKKVTDAVHAKGGVIYVQIWHTGRASDLPNDESHPVLAPSAIPIAGIDEMNNRPFCSTPRELTVDEIKAIVRDHAVAAKNALVAGFDGVEIHSAYGYLLDQFINTSSNKRTDAYGGSIENRVRLVLEVTAAVIEAIGSAARVGIRLSPWSTFHDMQDDSPCETWSYLVSQLQKNHPNMAFLDMIESSSKTLDPFRAIWKGPFISCGGYSRRPALAAKVAAETGNLIAFGRAFISNPDLVERLRNGWALSEYDWRTFYTSGAIGYNDYPTHVGMVKDH